MATPAHIIRPVDEPFIGVTNIKKYRVGFCGGGPMTGDGGTTRDLYVILEVQTICPAGYAASDVRIIGKRTAPSRYDPLMERRISELERAMRLADLARQEKNPSRRPALEFTELFPSAEKREYLADLKKAYKTSLAASRDRPIETWLRITAKQKSSTRSRRQTILLSFTYPIDGPNRAYQHAIVVPSADGAGTVWDRYLVKYANNSLVSVGHSGRLSLEEMDLRKRRLERVSRIASDVPSTRSIECPTTDSHGSTDSR